MNLGTLAGLMIAGAVLSLAVVDSAVDPALLWNPQGMLIVLGGTFAAAFVSFQFGQVLRVFRNFLIVLRNERLHPKRDIEELITVTQYWSKGDFRGLSRELDKITNPFLRLGAELATDVMTPIDDIVQAMRFRIERLRSKEAAEAAVFRAMATYAPAFGMMGTLLGLINMLRASGSGGDFAAISAGMGTALMTTLYGILLANLVFRPIAIKLENRTRQRVANMTLILEGLIVMRKQRSPGVTREMLRTFVAEQGDELRGRAGAAATGEARA